MKLGVMLGYWMPDPWDPTDLVREAERLGYDSAWTAEAYGSDVFSPLCWVGAHTSRIKLGTSVMQISARTPACVAMTAATIDHLSGGRLLLGIGVSGPQVVEGWYGQPFPKPMGRTREFVRLLRTMLRREGPVTFDGEHYTLPFPGGARLGKPLKLIIRPLRAEIPIYLGAEGPKNIALAAEICDGWLALFFAPEHEGFYRDALAEGFARDGARRSAEDFEIAATVPLIPTDDIEAGVDMLRPMYALYFGGMGAKSKNFHADVAVRMGFEGEVAQIKELYLSGKKDEAAAAVPRELIEQLALIGPPDKLRHDLEPWRDSIVTTLLVGGDAATLRTAAEVVLG